jgi:hypothetical protein
VIDQQLSEPDNAEMRYTPFAARVLAAGLAIAALTGCGFSTGTATPSSSISTSGTAGSSSPASVPPKTATGGVPPGGPAPGGAPLGGGITVTKSGGIAGVRQVLTIAPDGSWVFTDQKGGKKQNGRLTGSQLQQLAQMVADPALIAELRVPARTGVCNDAFMYAIAFRELTYRFEQCGGPTNHPRTDAVLNLILASTPM